MSLAIAYATPDLTHLRYYVPLATTLALRRPDTSHVFVYTRSSQKYNGLATHTNYSRFTNVIDELGFTHVDVGSCDSTFDTLVTVEHSVMSIKTHRLVTLSHGFDSILGHAKALHASKCIYVTNSLIAAAASDSDNVLHGLDIRTHPVPASMLQLDEYTRIAKLRFGKTDKKVMTIFYPDLGTTDIANSLISKFVTMGWHVHVKQRRKHQGISTSLGDHHYDEEWSPSESILLPLASDVTIGFGSTAYLDLCDVNVPYVNIDVRPNEHPWCRMLHPESQSYVRITDPDIDSIIQKILDFDHMSEFHVTPEHIDFYDKLICNT